ncbi:MAG: CDP-alcohol phosphatidyltransferase family protein [Flavobacteriaceae bacterium]|nr:CDP-alcohol phosphatidyltransferase family protein [Flavobacteriaceae bacterium]
MKKQIPNLFTLLNLLSGLIAIIMALSDKLVDAAFFVFLGIFFDFFDGFFARKFKVEGEFGKQLDSLADMVTSGVVPGIVMFQLILYATKQQWFMQLSCEIGSWQNYGETSMYYIAFIGLLIPLASAFRLAKFNIDERQSNSFVGLPTPALSIFIMSLPLILHYSDQQIFIDIIHNRYVLILITIIGSYLLNAEIPLFSLKFKKYDWATNKSKYIFIILTSLMLVLFKAVAIPLVIILYVIISVIENIINKNTVS